MELVKLEEKDNYPKCEAIRKLGYDVLKSGNGCVLTSKTCSNLDQFIDVYYKNVNEILMAFKNDLRKIGYVVAA